MTAEELATHAANMRKKVLTMACVCGTAAHLGGALSEIDILSVLYGEVMNTKNFSLPPSKRDKFILSKGHGVLALYAALAEFGVLEPEITDTFMQDGSDLVAHPVLNEKLGIEASSGSLGQGISLAVGLALAAKKKGYEYKVYVLCGNGECNEGSVWEAAMSAKNFGLDNLTLIIDNNGLQSDGASAEVFNVSDKYGAMLTALGWDVTEADGHNIAALTETFGRKGQANMPRAIIAHTVKGKGVSFMENNNEWHHNRLTPERYKAALAETESA